MARLSQRVLAFNNYKLVRGGLLIADQWRKKGTPRAVSNLPQDTDPIPEDRALVGSRMIGAYQGDPMARDRQPFSGEGRKPGLQTHISANAARRPSRSPSAAHASRYPV